MKNTLHRITASISGLSAAVLPVLALAQGQAPPSPIQNISGVQSFICTVIVGWMFTFLIVLTVVFVLVAAYKYLTAAGDPEKVKSASHMLIYAAVAIVVALFARGLPLIVGSLFSGGIGGATC